MGQRPRGQGPPPSGNGPAAGGAAEPVCQTRGVRVALFSDIHGNITGLRAVVAALDRLGGADVTFALGDLVAGGPGPDEVLDLLCARDVRLVRGNSEEAATDPAGTVHRVPDAWRSLVQQTNDWLHTRLTPRHWTTLAALPLTATVEPASGHRLLVCHATPTDPWARVCASDNKPGTLHAAFGTTDAEVVAYGHYHAHHVLHFEGKLLVNVASVGLRKDGLSAFTLMDHTAGYWSVRQFQVPYDTAEEARLMRERRVPIPTSALSTDSHAPPLAG